MKLLLTSVDALINSASTTLFPGIASQLDAYLSLSNDNKVVVISVTSERLKGIPQKYNPVKVPFRLRGKGPELMAYLKAVLDLEIQEVIILGAKDHDMYTAAHTNSIMLTALYAKKNNPNSKIYEKGYGIPLAKVASIGVFFKSFYNIAQPWYMKVNVNAKTTLYALTNANTFGLAGKPKEIKDTFLDCLKNDNNTYIVPFTSYFLVSAHKILNELSDIDFWDIYPSSKAGKENVDLLYFAKKAAHSFAKTFQTERLFIRQKDTTKRHMKSKEKRIETGCEEELHSMIINPFYKDKLKSKSVAVIDDFTRLGTSCEAARFLLESAGVCSIVFIAMGKFGGDRDYYRYTYKVKGDPFTGLAVKQASVEVIQGTLNSRSNKEFIDSLSNII